MSNKRSTKRSPFKPFTLCPDCRCPVVQFCPWCGGSIHPGSHGGTTFYAGGQQYDQMACSDCVARLNRGELPPFRSPWGLN